VYKKSPSPLISLEYSNGWDPLAKNGFGSRGGGDGFSQEFFESFMFNVDDVESATQYFSDSNLLGKSGFSAIYKGVLRDGSAVAVKCIAKTSCKSDEPEFLKGLKILTSLKHENLVRLRGLCCSKGRGECFLIYDFVANGNLLHYLDSNNSNSKFLDWSTRFKIIKGIAKGIGYLHANKANKPALVHQNISAEKVLIDQNHNPLLSNSGLHKLLADDIVFSTLKSSAAMGYLAPEYTTTGRFTQKTDIYAFGKIILQILSGKREITQTICQGAEFGRLNDYVDNNLGGKFVEVEAVMLGKIAFLCTNKLANHRPSIEVVIQEMG
jgi:serine/threonine protein kinase